MVERLRHSDLERVVDALCDAFRDYPVMRYILEKSGEDYDGRLVDLIGYFTAARTTRGWPVLGILEGQRVVAAANVNPPLSAAAPPELTAVRKRMEASIGPEGVRRFEAFAAACKPLEPDKPHYYVGMIGVRPSHQGKGLARPLMDEIHRMSAGDPQSAGVALTTETPDNVPFYEHFGYEVVGESRVQTLTTWTLFRADRS